MEVVKKINNNVAECVDNNGKHLIAFGKGIGFPKMPYTLPSMKNVDMTFYRLDSHFEKLISEIPEDLMSLSVDIVTLAQRQLNGRLNPTLVFSLADHMHFAIQRLSSYQEMKLLFSHDVEEFYPIETELGRKALQIIKEKLNIQLPKSEITAIAMHFVTSQTEYQQSQEEIKLAEVLERITQTIEHHLQTKLNREGFNYHRFENHLRYYIKRIHENGQFMDDNSAILHGLKKEKTKIYMAACQVGEIISQSYHLTITDDELLYLMIHINRLHEKTRRNFEMTKQDFKKLAEQIAGHVGGGDNVSNVTHCMTRLRFNLKDESLVDDEKVKAIKGVIGINHSGEQYQIIVGQTVDKVFAELTLMLGFHTGSTAEPTKVKKEKLTLKTAFAKMLDYLSGSMTPLIPAMITAAMFKTVQVILGPDLLKLISAESDLYLLCGFLYSAFFYFLPVFLGFTAAKKLGANQVMGLFVGALLIVPELVQLDGKSFDVYGFIPTTIHNYSQTVIPAVLSVWIMSYVESFFKKIVPAVLSTIFVPFLTIFAMTPLILALLAPIGNVLGQWIGAGLIAFGNTGGFVAVALVAALWSLLVMTGMHIVLITFALTGLLTNGVDRFIMVAAILATWATFGLAFGAALRIKDKEEKALTFGYVVSGLVGGVTEPTIYGVMLKYKRTIVTLAIGGFIAGIYGGMTQVGLYVAGASNFLSVVGYFAGGTSNIINGFIATALAFFGTAALTYFFGFEREQNSTNS